MLAAPGKAAQAHAAYEPVLRLCSTVLLRANEVAKHYRYDLQHVHNMRARGKGPPWVKLGGEGAVRYRLSELLAWEIHGQRGAWTFDRVSLALATMPGMTPEMRRKIEAHLRTVLDGETPD